MNFLDIILMGMGILVLILSHNEEKFWIYWFMWIIFVALIEIKSKL
jgi:hypothetical protein